MKSSQFAVGYQDRQPWVRRDSHPLRAEVLSQSAEKSAQFSSLLLSYLQGVRMTPQEANEVIGSYNLWLKGAFSNVMFREDLFDDDPDPDVVDEFYDEIMFSATNLFMHEIWKHLLVGEAIPRNEIENCQIRLAVASVSQIHPLAKKYRDGKLYKLDNQNGYHFTEPRDSGLMALATQFDAMIAYLDAMKVNRNLVVVPAPPQFETSGDHSERNVDLIAIDTHNDNAHGLQVKMNAKASKRRGQEYDESYVTTIDGMNDLKNFVFMRTGHGSETVGVPMPGLYSAHFLINRKGLFRFGHKKGTGVIHDPVSHNLMLARQMAFSLTDLAPSVNQGVSQHLSEVALRNLDPAMQID